MKIPRYTKAIAILRAAIINNSEFDKEDMLEAINILQDISGGIGFFQSFDSAIEEEQKNRDSSINYSATSMFP